VNAREEILSRIRAALADIPPGETPEQVPVPRHYLPAHTPQDPRALADLLADNLTDYRAHVQFTETKQLPYTIADLLARHGSRTVAIPTDLPDTWLSALPEHIRVIPDHPPLTPADLDQIDSVLTGCALAIAETGTLILDTGPTQGRRALTLIPDHHLCIVHARQITASLPRALPSLDPTRPQTWISGPSATSDIELNRVEGVHGPRHLDVIIANDF
jgi:L-lactate dehydrogenase complex protein LldG